MNTKMNKITPALLLLACSSAIYAQKNDKPNVLFIAIDDLRPDLLGCYGNTEVKSPNINELASESIVFQRAYCQAPISMPSRASVLSGYRPETIHYTRQVTGHVPENTVTLPALFKKNGYNTVSIGKIYHENDDDPDGWCKRYTHSFIEGGGYCSGYSLPENIATVNSYLRGLKYKGLPASSIMEIVDKKDEDTPDGKSADYAIYELRKFKETGEPFFLAVGFYRPHLPLTAPKKYWDMYDVNRIVLPDNYNLPSCGHRENWGELRRYGDIPSEGLVPEKKAKELIRGYRASVSFVDAQVGKVLDELKALGLDKNTIVVLWSDHGYRLGEHGEWSKLAGEEKCTRVAMMFKVPGYQNKGFSWALTELVDIYPTLAELCKFKAPKHLEGTSLVPLMKDKNRPWKKATFSGFHKFKTIRTDNYRLIEHYDNTVELYNYQIDPCENYNLAEKPEYSEVVNELRLMLKKGWKEAVPNE